MSERKHISDKHLLEVSSVTFGGKETVKHYLSKAYKAGKTAKTDLAGNNIPHFVHNATVIIQAVEQLWTLLGDDRVEIDDKKK